MRSITITYEYDGEEAPWRTTIDGFIQALNQDPDAQGFSYQVAVADDGLRRIHWGRWDATETLKHVQSQDYFKTFAAKVQGFAAEGPAATGADIVTRTDNW